MARDAVVLSFHDVVLRKNDIDLLNGPYWLNDTLISFYFQYLEKISYKDENCFLFVGPEVTQCLKFCPVEDLKIFLEPLSVHRREFIFFPVNDCETADSPGGSHWSLLVFSKPEQGFFHFDSSSGFNVNHAHRLALNVAKHILSSDPDFKEVDCLQQSNCYDCGVHLLCTVDLVADFCLKNGVVSGVPHVKKMVVNTKRTEVKELIEELS